MKRLTTFWAVLVFLTAPLYIGTNAYAASSENVIQDGLWKGYNMVFGNQQPTSSDGNSSDATTKKFYAALGDSVAAGLGLPAASSPNAAICGRSAQAYSSYVAKNVALPVINVACSGATAGDLYTKQASSGLPAQITAAYAAGRPELITITAGANDVRWAKLIQACYAYDCNTAAYSTAASAYRAALYTKLLAAFAAIEAKPGTAPSTIITGYYNPVSAQCSQIQSSIKPSELDWIAGQTAALNLIIQRAASHYSFVRYAPVDFSGHDICSNKPWVQGLSASAPLHPTAAGQKAIASSILNVYQQ